MLKQLTLFERAKTDSAAGRILRLLSDHEWHNYYSISNAADTISHRYRDPIRRLRELREMGYVISKRRSPDNKLLFEYRLERE